MSFLKLHREFLRRPFVAAFISGAGRKFHVTTKPLSMSRLAPVVSLRSPCSAHALLGRRWALLGAALQSLPGGQGWRNMIPGHGDGACPSSSMRQRFPAQLWPRPAGAPLPWSQGTGRGGPRASPGGQFSCGSTSLGGRGLNDAEARGSSRGPVLVSVDMVCVVGSGSLLRSMQPNTKSTFSDWQTSG